MFSQFSDQTMVRGELFRIASALKAMGVTAVLTAERTEDHGPVARFGVEEFIADNVLILRNVLEDETRRRTIEILKFRGCDHQKGEYPFTIVPRGGVIVIPLSAMQLSMKSSSAGNPAISKRRAVAGAWHSIGVSRSTRLRASAGANAWISPSGSSHSTSRNPATRTGACGTSTRRGARSGGEAIRRDVSHPRPDPHPPRG